MAYTTFSTEKADYVLDLGNHIYNRRNLQIFEGIDALVLEQGACSPNALLNYVSESENKDLIDYCSSQNIPIYLTDCPDNSFGFIRTMFGLFLEIPIIPLLIYYSLSKTKVNSSLHWFLSNYSFLSQTPIVEGRNAMNAKKIEEFVAEEIQKTKGKRPKIGIHFGAGHMGLREDLKSKRRRDFSIWNHEKFDVRRFASFKSDLLNKVYVARYKGNNWGIEEIVTDLFPKT